jgi:hypothetical protein
MLVSIVHLVLILLKKKIVQLVFIVKRAAAFLLLVRLVLSPKFKTLEILQIA